MFVNLALYQAFADQSDKKTNHQGRSLRQAAIFSMVSIGMYMYWDAYREKNYYEVLGLERVEYLVDEDIVKEHYDVVNREVSQEIRKVKDEPRLDEVLLAQLEL
jgi:hypothetical protein